MMRVDKGELTRPIANIERRTPQEVFDIMSDRIQRMPMPAPAHPDDLAVDRFAFAMKMKLAKKRKEGKIGWYGDLCENAVLSKMLRDHVEKEDPVDVGNLAMMIHQRGETIATQSTGEWKVKVVLLLALTLPLWVWGLNELLGIIQ